MLSMEHVDEAVKFLCELIVTFNPTIVNLVIRLMSFLWEK